jgi:hypothetical protein
MPVPVAAEYVITAAFGNPLLEISDRPLGLAVRHEIDLVERDDRGLTELVTEQVRQVGLGLLVVPGAAEVAVSQRVDDGRQRRDRELIAVVLLRGRTTVANRSVQLPTASAMIVSTPPSAVNVLATSRRFSKRQQNTRRAPRRSSCHPPA